MEGTIIPSGSFRTFNAKACIYELEPSLHQFIGIRKEVITLNIIIPCDWVGAIRNLWTTKEHECPCSASNTSASNTGPFNYPCDSNILLYAVNNPKYNIDKTFPRGPNNTFVERYRNDIFRFFYNENPHVTQEWYTHIQDIMNNTDPYIPTKTVDEDKVTQDLQYIPNVNILDRICFSPTNSYGTDTLSKLINNINVGEILDLLWNYFYHDYSTCEDDHSFDPYNVLSKDDELCFPVHILSIIGYSDKTSLLTVNEDDIIYDYHINIRFKQDEEPIEGTYIVQDTQKPIVGEDIPTN